MKTTEYRFSYEVYDAIDELAPEDALLLRRALQMTQNAWAPYSRFRVGAAARMQNGEIVTGANQENAAYPAGLCAESVLLSTAGATWPGLPIDTLAVSYEGDNIPNDHPISPCGICRQRLQEFETRTQHPIRLILGGSTGKIYIIPDANLLMPLAFTANELP
ncbi:cytidine deaminase [Paraflavitalea sp. CAU 1676]|uniref:cytidine deaminase n=1 Tax=Paraflavitalea sp. CAU 1676 TaxID=3032598 RepID=UPI0023DA73A9|nr:cytidine deaminase [Paraflavitalea sp. CAU 1676]MDF2187844.1 cytidine deaminase [Paraflavitalea sp. CAU 1676]